MPSHILVPKLPAKQGSGVKVLGHLDAMIDYTKTEKGNFTYLFFVKEDQPDLIMGIEEYAQKSDLCSVHMPSKEFKAFAGALEKEELFAGELGLGNYESASGFITRDNVHTSDGKYVWFVEIIAKDNAARDEILQHAKTVTEYVYNNEPKTLSYLMLKSLDDDKKMAVFEVYDNKEALTEIHYKSEAFLAFGKALRDKGLVASKESVAYKTIGKGYFAKNGQGLGLRT